MVGRPFCLFTVYSQGKKKAADATIAPQRRDRPNEGDLWTVMGSNGAGAAKISAYPCMQAVGWAARGSRARGAYQGAAVKGNPREGRPTRASEERKLAVSSKGIESPGSCKYAVANGSTTVTTPFGPRAVASAPVIGQSGNSSTRATSLLSERRPKGAGWAFFWAVEYCRIACVACQPLCCALFF